MEGEIMKKTVTTAASALFLGIFVGVAGGQETAPPSGSAAMHEGHRDQLDTDKSGAVNRAEYQTFMAQAFEKLDTDRDGSLRAGDVSQILTAEQFAAMDDTGDGRVTRAEFMDHVLADFAQADRSGDGQLK
jgi:Ca2+-binding EF-hand superfamily protein